MKGKAAWRNFLNDTRQLQHEQKMVRADAERLAESADIFLAALTTVLPSPQAIKGGGCA